MADEQPPSDRSDDGTTAIYELPGPYRMTKEQWYHCVNYAFHSDKEPLFEPAVPADVLRGTGADGSQHP